jgi:predicted secreted protein
MADVEITENGSTTTVEHGDEIVLRLPENATTGYQWSIESVTGPLAVVHSELLAPGAAETRPAPGAAGERLVRIRATEPGVGSIKLNLKRAWEPNAAAEFTAAVTVT